MSGVERKGCPMTALDRRGFLLGVGGVILTPAARADTGATSDDLRVSIVSGATQSDKLSEAGVFDARVIDVDGVTVVSEFTFHNLMPTVGKNLALSDLYTSGTTFTACDMGLIAASPTLAAGDTMSSHTGWTEITTGIAARVAPTWGTASGGTISTSSAVNFVPSGTSIVAAGAFVVVNGTTTLGSTAGTLTNEGTFSSAQTVASGQTLQVSQGVTLTLNSGDLEMTAGRLATERHTLRDWLANPLA